MELTTETSEASPKKEASRVFTIYCHAHLESGRRYVGLTKLTMMKRWNQHVSNAKKKTGKGCAHLWNAIRKYGKDAFSHEVLEVCDSLDDANTAEQKWIAHLDTTNPEKGFNLKKGGGHRPHPVRNPWDRPEFREKYAGKDMMAATRTPAARAAQKAALTTEKRSAATRVAMARPDVKEKRGAFQKDPEYRGRISASLAASLADPSVREAMSERSKALHEDSGYRERVSAGVAAAVADPGVKERHRAAVKRAQSDPGLLEKRRAYRATDETKAKLSKAAKGRTHSPEAVERMRRIYWERRGLPVPA
jgi:group I intron endonuclease